jgi:tRNA-guanine family transglycosylase
MKIFLSWSPVPPDPPFWKWIELDGIVVSIALLKQERILEQATLMGLHEFLNFDGPIFLDSGSYEDSITNKQLRPKSAEELLTIAEWLGVDFVSHLDTPFVGKNANLSDDEKWSLLYQNIVNAKVCQEIVRRRKTRLNVVYVIQGWNRESLTYCAQELAKLKEHYYALGSLIGLKPQEIEFRVRLVRDVLGREPKLHLFAVSGIEVVKRVKFLVDSLDSSTASIAGAMKEVICSTGKRRHMDNIKQPLECKCPVCQSHRGKVLLMGKEGSWNYYNKLRKIHNAYNLIQNIKKATEDG